ncbi:MAG TPA: CoA pyrophosphatase [Usitatibacter sp.]|jgi:8-oxo-dGTP pyrophosphatase MutT (NUDIX family)|nr:CoA pyrophosphatase [Usitatibacter sp.]
MDWLGPPKRVIVIPTREELVRRLGSIPPIEQLLGVDDLEKLNAASGQPLRDAAVLLLIVDHASGPTVVFTQRTAHLADHAGQISFPGGRTHPGDGSPERTALREAEEEIGLPPEKVQVLGRLPEYRTGTGFAVTPIVGWTEPPIEYRPDPHEVEAVFEVPLAFLLDPANHRYESAFFKGALRKYWAMPYGERFIWGATAAMLVVFHRIVSV